ncbi:Lactococcin-G-processing and transport ATP-binding protein LagD [Seminavis robusta]|uniref:Lactococcin-G-processing and transport ATP-binding protein LagD n=1 Tax=Seminavis robusta TaxID=568900 RepID=A0A9N8DAF7_9STRA|nr:Lactococcin-G-processing and transport ATP-binding protein LagD [Seminavis robusta]|eukprot:Sro34_g021790.1 Lactococcin-G-processing and transport ATP-binding protein LagD (990) ;mRNA; r:8182-11151
MPRHHGRVLGASMAGILNSDAQDDEEAKRRVLRTFGSVLGLLFLLDIGCAFSVLWIACASSDDGGDSVGHCVSHAVGRGFRTFHPMANNDGKDTLGDLFALAILRCLGATVLLVLGVKYASPPKPMSNTTEDTAGTEDSLTEPLLNTQASSASTSDDDDPAAGGAEPQSQEAASQPHDPQTRVQAQAQEGQPNNNCFSSLLTLFGIHQQRLTPTLIKTLVLGILFVVSSFYQVYAGLKVSTLDHPATESIIPLLCLTVFWINAQAYVFRTLLLEMTREEGLYLPPEVHRHPMYFENSRNVSIHWCDLCHRPIGGRNNNTSNNNPQNNNNNACYRCALCDFDVCLACAKRNDAATVGENVLRGDRGVRVEEALTTTGYVQRSMEIAKAELPLLLLSFILLGATSVSRLLLPHFQGHIIDKVIPDPNTGQYDKDGFLHFIRIYIAIMVTQGAVSTFYRAILTLVSRRLKFTLRNALFEKILIQDVAYFDGTESGRLISRLTNELDLMMAPIQSSLSSLLGNILLLFGGLVMCFAKSYRLSMISFVTIGPISALWESYAFWSRGLAREMISYWAEGNSIAAQALSHVRTIKAFGCEHQVLQKYSDTNRQALNCGVKDAWGNAVTTALTGYLDLGSGVLILYFGGLLVYRGELTVGELVTFQLFWNMMNDAFQSLQGLITTFTRSAAGAEKVFSMWDSHPDIDPQKGTSIHWKVDGHMQLKDVTFYYQMRPDNIVLNKFNLDIPAGKTLALVGRSGGGKSTIINLLLRFYDPRGGKLVLDGRDYESIKVHELRRLFGVVTQETELFALTVEENIAYGLDKDEYTMEDIITAAKKAYAHDFIIEMKDGYQTRIGERGNRLSGGQRQRLAIARVFLRKPKIILLDEATSALDENSQEAVQQALANLIAESQATVVLVAHRLSTVVNADSICVIDKGTVLEQGNHEELVAKGGVYASMVEKQLKKKDDMLDQDKKAHGDKDSKVAADDIDALLDGN